MTRGLQNGSLPVYLTVIVLCMAASVGWPWIGNAVLSLPTLSGSMAAVGLVLLIFAATVVVVTAMSPLAAICGLGGVGAGVALIFLVFGAPDLALTQLMVETLTVIIVSLVLPRLPSLKNAKKRPLLRRIMTAGLCAAVGVLITSLLMGINQSPLDRNLTAFYESKSYLAAHGRNIVNVILVDFRALDTLGEITVVVLAAWAGIALIRKSKERNPCNPSS
jgi:multicomponent Na+:H+ antiporter subunit A